MDDSSIGIGRIQWLDLTNESGIISQEGEEGDIYFEFGDVEGGSGGSLKEDQEVQFLKEQGRLGTVAKKIIVLSDAARAAGRRGRSA